MRETQTTFEDELSREILPDDAISESSLHYQRLTLVKQLTPIDKEGNLIRQFTFKTGLNILWAEPEKADENANLYNDSYAGHSTGKTLFCRILRHLLSESNFGTAALHKQVEATFTTLWVVAEIRLNEQSWIVGRSLINSNEHFAIQDDALTTEAILENPPEFRGYKSFTRELESLCPTELHKLYPDEAWRNLIPWIARDQEERFSSIISWRSSLSEADNPRTTKETRNLILRAMLHLLEEDEASTRESINSSSTSLQTLEANTSLKSTLLKNAKNRVDKDLTKVPNLNLERIDPEEDKKHVVKQREIREESIEHFESIPDHAKVLEAREQLQVATNNKAAVDVNITTLNTELPKLKEQADQKLISLSRFKAKGLEDPSRIDKNWCPKSYQTACDRECVTDHSEDNITALTLAELEKEAQDLQTEYNNKASELAKLETRQEKIEAEIKTKKQALQAALRKYPSPAITIQKQIGFLETLESNLDEEIQAASALKIHHSTIDRTKDDLGKQRQKLSDLKEVAATRLSSFSEIFGDVTRAVVGSTISGSVSLTDSGLKPKIKKKSELGGAAMETVKTIAFDLASIIHSIEGKGSHPRFLIHDGPRESDMAQVMYEHFFRYVQKIEQAFPSDQAPFQYILTTTTPPPLGMREGSKWLLGEKLSGKSKEGRLLKEDF